MPLAFTPREENLITYLKTQRLSPSHDVDHLQRVAEIAVQLAEVHQAQREVVVAAALLHDLGRSDTNTRGPETARTAANQAPEILQRAGFTQVEITQITQAIAEHDDPKFHSTLLESRILKDADYLDGFGARGVLRSLIYAGETGGGVTEAVDRIKRKMRERLDGLEFTESRRLAWKQWRLVEVFLQELALTPEITSVTYPGKFIVFEGISGSGKNTQADLLADYLKTQGQSTLVINHPTSLLKEVWQLWKPQVENEVSDVFLFLADRFQMVRQVILPALKQGQIVISSRSSITAQAYQASPDVDASWYRLWFAFEPLADLVVYLDLDPQVAAERKGGQASRGEDDPGFFGHIQKTAHDRYPQILGGYPNVVSIDASQPTAAVQAEIQSSLSQSAIKA